MEGGEPRPFVSGDIVLVLLSVVLLLVFAPVGTCAPTGGFCSVNVVESTKSVLLGAMSAKEAIVCGV